MLFEALPLSKVIQKALVHNGYITATPIQEKAIPLIIKGNDIVGCAQTGTGKTAAFAIPILNHLHHIVGSSKKTKVIRAAIITPTRELAIQIGKNFETYGQYTNIKQLTLFGGVSQTNQVDSFKKGIDILVATPGRLLDLYKQGYINLDQLHTLVIDEADQMLDMGFINDVKKIIKLTPDNRQTLLFSATMPLAIRELVDHFLKAPQYITITPISSTAQNVTQKVYFVGKEHKKQLLYHLIRNEKLTNVLVFSRTKYGAENIVKALQKNQIQAQAIHGDKSQTTRQKVLEAFKSKEINILVATDIAARGIDIDQLSYVINFDIPNIPETYVHRIGRTGRAGNVGTAISFCSKEEQSYWTTIEKLIKIKVKEEKDHPYTSSITQTAPEEMPKKTDRGRSKSRKSTNSKKNKKRWY